jgi:hypothetical protein
VCSNSECGKYVDTNTPWICGSKGCRNDNIDDFPFIYKCEHCGDYPKAYQCHHCGKLIYFTKDEQKDGYAECANDALKPRRVKQRDGHQETIIDKREGLELKEFEIQDTKKEIELKRLKRDLNPQKPKLKRLEIKTAEQELEEFMKQRLGREDAADAWRAKIKEKHKDDPAECERQLALVDKWVRQHLQ